MGRATARVADDEEGLPDLYVSVIWEENVIESQCGMNEELVEREEKGEIECKKNPRRRPRNRREEKLPCCSNNSECKM